MNCDTSAGELNLAASVLRSGLSALRLRADLEPALLHYLELLQRWNQVYNLTAIRTIPEMVTKHLLDCLAITPYIAEPENLLDIGSGAGLPAIPLALLYPELPITALDSNSKKTRFITQVALELKIANLTVIQERAERYKPLAPYALVTARAFAALPKLLELAAPLLKADGRLLALKGAPESTPADGWQSEIIALQVPGLEQAERHLIIARKLQP